MNDLGNKNFTATAFAIISPPPGFLHCPAALALHPAMGGHLNFREMYLAERLLPVRGKS